MSASAITLRALEALSPGLQAEIRAHILAHGKGELALLVAAVWLRAIAAGEDGTPKKILEQARSDVRRETQDPAHWAAGFGLDDDINPDDVPAARTCRRGAARREKVLWIAAREGITERAAQLRVRKMIEKAQMGDLFAVGGAV